MRIAHARIALFLCTAALVLAQVSSGQQAQNAQAPRRETFFPVSVWYAGGRARAPMLEPVTPESRRLWKQDLEKIKALGFNTVRTWVEWSAAEPRAGEYHLEQLDLMLQLAEEVGLKVFVQVYVDSAPEWAGEKFPDGRFVAQNGEAIKSQAAPGYCTDHPGVRKAVLDLYREIARHVRTSPAFFGWDLWSEPHVLNWAEITYIPHASFCYCRYSLARFRRWLEGKYGSLDALNRSWYRNFRDWEQVEPPRFDTILSYTDFVDWRVFITDRLAEDLRARNDAVKEIVPDRVTTSHSAVPGVFTSLAAGDGNPDDWLMYRSVDYYGVSLYPKHSLPPHWSLARRALAMDFTRSASQNKGFYVGELQGGFGVRGDVVSDPITPEDLQMYMWGAVARGAKGINIYALYAMSSGYESGGYGLLPLDGTITERAKAAGRAAQILSSNADLLLNSAPQAAEVGILFNHLTTLIGGQQHSYNPAALRDSTAGWHRIFFERNIPVDFLSAREFDAGALGRYKLVVVPYPIMMTARVAGALEQYVRDGGRLFVEARPGWVDERGYAQPTVPGFGWDKMLGVREQSVTPRQEVSIRLAPPSGAADHRQSAITSRQFLGARFQERFEAIDPAARPIAYFDDNLPAGYDHAYGKGRAIILGTFAGQINETKPAERHPLGEMLITWAGLTPPDLHAPGAVELKQLVSPAGRVVFVFNHASNLMPVELTVPLEKPARKVTELTTARAMDLQDRRRFVLEAELPAQSVRVYRIDY